MLGREKLDAYLKQWKIRPVDFAAQLDTSEVTVYRWLSGESVPSWGAFRKINAATSGLIRPDDFLHDDHLG